MPRAATNIILCIVFVILSHIAPSFSFAQAYRANSTEGSAPTRCNQDSYIKSGFEEEYVNRFNQWMFGPLMPKRVYKASPPATESKESVSLHVSVYAPLNFDQHVDVGVYNAAPKNNAQPIAIDGLNYLLKLAPERLLAERPPGWIVSQSDSAPKINYAFVFVRDGNKSIPDRLVDSEIDAFKKASAAPISLDEFNPDTGCKIYRQRNGYRVLKTYGVVESGAPPEKSARCLATTMIVGLGFSNAESIFTDKDLVVRRSASGMSHVSTRQGVINFKNDESDLRYRVNEKLLYMGYLYDEINGTPLFVGGEDECAVRNSFFKKELSHCAATKEANVAGKYKASVPPIVFKEIEMQCSKYGIALQ